MADASARSETTDRIDRLESAAQALDRAEEAVDAVGEARLDRVADSYEAFRSFIDENDGKATGSGREAFEAYVAFQDELVARIERLPDDLLEREAFERVGELLDKRRLSADDMERAREALEPAAERAALLTDRREARQRYRDARRAVANRLQTVESAIADRRQLLRYADADLEADLSVLRSPIASYNEAVRSAFAAYKRTVPSREVVALLDVAGEYPLVDLDSAPTPLARYLRDAPVGQEPVSRLLELADHSRSKLAHFVDDPDRFRAIVAANRTYLARLDAGPLTVEWPPPSANQFRYRARELVAIVDRFADEETVAALHHLRDLVRRPDYESLRESAIAQAALDADERERLRSGAVERELESLREERDRLSAALESHPRR